MLITIRMTATGLNLDQTHITQANREYKEEVVAATPAASTNVLRSYSVARDVDTENGKSAKKVLSYEGKSVRLKRVNNVSSATISTGALSADDQKELITTLKGDDAGYFPEKPVALGDTWKQSLKKILGGSSDIPDGDANLTFLEFTQQNGHKCAHIQMKASVSQDLSGITLSGDLTGDLYFAVDINRTLQMDLDGPLKMNGKQTAGDKTIEINGTGKLHVSSHMLFLQVAGKPQVPATK